MRRRPIIIVITWTVAIALACALDATVARFMHDSGIAAEFKSRELLSEILKIPGEYWFAVTCAAFFFLRAKDWQSAGFVILATGISGTNGIFKWILGRTRPYKLFDAETGEAHLVPFHLHPFRGGIPGLFDGRNLCFPSGHACMAFAVAESLAILFPRGRWAFYSVASVTALQRVAENAHYLSDCIAAAALGIAGVHLTHWLWFRVFLPRFEKSDEASSKGFFVKASAQNERIAIPLSGYPGLQRAGEHSHFASTGQRRTESAQSPV